MSKLKSIAIYDSLLIVTAIIGLIIFNISLFTAKAKNSSSISNDLPQDKTSPEVHPSKFVGRFMQFPNDPIRITDIKIKGQSVALNSKSRQDADWLNGLEVSIKNISEKNIVSLSIDLLFPETKLTPNSPTIAYPMHIGTDPMLAQESPERRLIRPGEEIKIELSDSKFQKLKKFIEVKRPIETINAVNIDISFIMFDDNTAWATGAFMHRDPNNPKRWIDN